MNIFVLDTDPTLAAQWQQDAHVVKMPLESAQMACTAVVSLGGTAEYKSTHRRHPCTLWLARSLGNARWMLAHGRALFDEYEARFDREHKSRPVFESAMADLLTLVPERPATPFALAMPAEYHGPDPAESYRRYYIAEKMVTKKGPATWRRNRPQWVSAAIA